MRIIFFGNPDFCQKPLQALNDSENEIISVVTSTDRKAGRGLKLVPSFVKTMSKDLNIPTIEVDDLKSIDFRNTLVKLKADLFVVVAFKFLPESIIGIPKFGSINVHPSLLPKYRGSSPIQYALLNGDVKTGVSIINLNTKIDAGNIIGLKEYTISKNANYEQLHNDLSFLGSKLLIEVINNFKTNTIKSINQDESKKTLAPKIKKIDLKIDWNEDVFSIHNKIRAFDPHPGAYSFINGKRIKLFQSRIIKVNLIENKKAGQIIIDQNRLCIYVCDNSCIEVCKVQLEGKTKNKSSDFIKSLSNNDYILE